MIQASGDKRSSLQQKGVNYCVKEFKELCPAENEFCSGKFLQKISFRKILVGRNLIKFTSCEI
jgi:hypothetical protein